MRRGSPNTEARRDRAEPALARSVEGLSGSWRLEAGLLPVPGLRRAEKTATFTSRTDKHLRVDFLTPMHAGREEVFEQTALGVNLQPLRFLEFILEDVHQAVVLSALGAALVNVPDPARFALHKRLVFAERRRHDASKALKDARQRRR